MKKPNQNILRFLILFILLSCQWVQASPVQAGSGDPYALIDAVNAYRNANGLNSLDVNSNLMAAAQSQADYLAATYDIGSGANGHVGAGGSNASDRAYAFGYGDGKAITVSENWAGTSVMSAEELVYSSFWADAAHQNTMLDGWGTHYKEIGVGVATQDGGVSFYVLDVGVVDGSENYSPSNNTYVNPAVVNGTDSPTYVFSPLVTSTPASDGNLYHTVRAGDTLSSIAQSYGVTADRIRDLNSIAEGWTMINEGQLLLIKLKSEITPAAGTTVTPTVGTTTPQTPTKTEVKKATSTPGIQLPSPTYAPLAITVVSSQTAEPVNLPQSNSRTMGIVLVIICGIGLAGVVAYSFLKPGK